MESSLLWVVSVLAIRRQKEYDNIPDYTALECDLPLGGVNSGRYESELPFDIQDTIRMFPCGRILLVLTSNLPDVRQY